MDRRPSASTLIAVDTNILLDLAVGHEDVVDALNVIRRRISSPNFGMVQRFQVHGSTVGGFQV